MTGGYYYTWAAQNPWYLIEGIKSPSYPNVDSSTDADFGQAVISSFWQSGSEIQYVNYTEIQSMSDSSLTYGANHLDVAAMSWNGNLAVTIYWIDARAIPPNNVMPTVSFPADWHASSEIDLTNSQSSATPSPFQQEINMTQLGTLGLYPDLRNDLGNIRFCLDAACREPLNSWLESCQPSCNQNSTDVVVWVNLPNGIPASSTTTIYFSVLDNSTIFTSPYWGEAPSLSATYGEYDNGNDVFNYYTNFNGTSLTSSLLATEITTSFGGGSSGSYSVDNGLNVTAAGAPSGGWNGGYSFDTQSQFSPSISEAEMVQDNFPGTVSLESISIYSSWDIISTHGVGVYTAGYYFEFRECGCGNYYILGAAGGSSTTGGSGSMPIGYYGLAWPSTGNEMGYLSTSQTLSWTDSSYSYASSYAGFGFFQNQLGLTYSASFDWFRVRSFPPDGVMPAVSFLL
jgi:hypothetical protein